jgi:SanA protein
VPEEDVLQDPYGVDTYDSMRRAANVNNIQQALIYTQKYHVSRAVYIARNLGIQAYARPVDRDQRWQQSDEQQREFLARIKAFIEVDMLSNPEVQYRE